MKSTAPAAEAAAPAGTTVPAPRSGPTGPTGATLAPRSAPAASRGQERGARALVWMYAASTVLAVAFWAMRHRGVYHPGPLQELLILLNVPIAASLASIATLVVITSALVGRKQVGLAAVAVFQFLGLLVGVVMAIDLFANDPLGAVTSVDPLAGLARVLDALAAVTGVAGLWFCRWVRPAFPGRLRRGSWTVLAVVLACGFAVAALVAWAVVAATQSRDVTAQMVRTLLERSIGFDSGIEPARLERMGPILPQLPSFVVAVTILVGVGLFLRTARNPTQWTPEREIALRGLLSRWGADDSLGYFSLRRDKASIFSPDGRAAICYDVVAGVSLASGDPVGDPASWPAAVAAWKAEARYHGWSPAVIAAGERAARVYTDAGLSVIALGDEAILEPALFRINNTSMTPVRRAMQHARRAGLSVQIARQGDLEPEEVARLCALADAWRVGDVERGFSMALDRHGDPADDGTMFVVARDALGDPVGLLSFVPWGAHGLSLDLMRRSPAAPGGTTELLVAELMAHAGEFGVRHVSLNFAFLRGVFADAERLGAGAWTRFNSSMLGKLDRFFQLERLYRANQKFEPTWRPRYLCFDSRLSMPQVAVACGMAEGFLPRPAHLRGRTPTLSPQDLELAREAEAAPVVDVAALAPRRADQTRARMRHLDVLRAAGDDPYAVGVPGATRVRDLHPSLWADPAPVRVTGRVERVRDHGGVVFLRLVDSGRGVQVVLERDVVGPEVLALVHAIDFGDLVVVEGTPGASRTGTPSLLGTSIRVVAKALHPVPFGAFDDPRARQRRRSTDLLVHPEGADLLRLRSRVITSLRATLDAGGYLEVETPILHTVHGGASARPFQTFINAYGMDLSMRIAPELYLKRLVIGGLGPLYEIGRNFRNEGADATHNPEFTSLEAYEPFGDYTSMRLLTQRLVRDAAVSVYGRAVLPLRTGAAPAPAPAGAPAAVAAQGLDVATCDAAPARPLPPGYELVDVSTEWPVVPVLEAVSQAVGRPIDLDTDFEVLLGLARAHDVPVRPEMGPGAIIEELYGELVEANTTFPTFYVDFPVETSPLTGAHRDDPRLAERWDLVVNGMELGTAYSELTDPLEQRRRLTEQSLKAAAGDVEAMSVDQDFLRALEVGMPPCGGLGIGVDRLVMLLAATNIRQVLSFPFVRPS